VLFFQPEGYPRARSLLLVSDGAECAAAIEGGALRVTAPLPGSGEVSVKYDGDDLQLSLAVDSGARESDGFPIFLAPYRLDLRFEGISRADSGTMVFEVGQWSSF
jgi:hypothetical protein